MTKGLKITVTILLLLLAVVPLVYFLVYPIYNDILMKKNSFDIYRFSKQISINLLTQISPSADVFAQEILGTDSMEESLKTEDLVLADTLLEDTKTKVIIDSVNIEGYISQGLGSDTMMRGFWHFPTSVYPGVKGNSVIIAHRFQYLPPAKNTFFNLDKVKVGDNILLQGEGGEYTYIVTNIKEVSPNDTSVLMQTDDYRVTLITCTPLWTNHKRLVVTAKLDKLYKKV